MRPSEAFGRPRHVAAADSDAVATPLASGGHVLAGGNSSSTAGNVGPSSSGSGVGASPMVTYFVADEDDVDAAIEAAAIEAAGRDPESFKAALLQNARHFPHNKMAAGSSTQGNTGKASHAAAPSLTFPTAPTAQPARDRVSGAAGDDDKSQEPRPSTPDLSRQHQARHGHAHSITTSHPPSLPPNFSPLFSQSTSTSLFGTPGPASLSATSSPSSRQDSLSGSLLMDDPSVGGSAGGDGPISRDMSFDLDRGPGSISFGPSISGAGIASANETTRETPTTDRIAASRREADHSSSDAAGAAAAATTASFLLGASSAGFSTTDTDSMMMDSGSAPQLIMPSIKMPSRRPFTEEGKNMGRLKVLIAGDSGLGKTSLIKAIVQSCPHIVHVDHVTPTSFSLSGTRRSSAATATTTAASTVRARRKSSRSTRPDLSTNDITEIYASTKPYPTWWNEVSDAGGVRRRKSLGDNVLDRNICFVDTPGFTRNTSTMDTIMPVVEYVEGYLKKLCTNSLSDADFVGLVSGDGGTSVDAVFYMISGHLTPADIEYLRLLTPLTNVIPVLARADTLHADKDIAEAKETIARQLHEANIKPFVFTVPTATQDLALTLASSSGLPQPYAVSSANGSDHDVMDASLLMSPDYVQPLVPTDLAALVEQVFCRDGISRLRHAAAQKFAKWRRSDAADSPLRPQSLYRPLGLGGGNELGILPGSPGSAGARPGVLTTPLGAPSSFALARITDHTQREEHLARIRLANWAAELQRSLDSERAHYENLARNERAVWLTERLSECVQDGTLVAVPPAARDIVRQTKQEQAKLAKKKKKTATKSAGWSLSSSSSSSTFSHEDPLGLLQVTAGLRARGMLVLEVLGGLSVLGGMALWMARHNYHLQVYDWVMGEWSRLWNGER
ncbi:hypothetical protein HMPREF1624_03252 [Sporothrix schenckii ATCC 58251]|uniref:Septin-type G domain-containing protein n=1 Tax=Sporothrix schenckii (strain ATCC 58251 / de Perez 2211183) TaxID=1391915 RepID=U7PZK6_SPOS1|nr:hypothetical protein HMPREF1624_03252 [Sporothrix schenckii ATCC 58251]